MIIKMPRYINRQPLTDVRNHHDEDVSSVSEIHDSEDEDKSITFQGNIYAEIGHSIMVFMFVLFVLILVYTPRSWMATVGVYMAAVGVYIEQLSNRRVQNLSTTPRFQCFFPFFAQTVPNSCSQTGHKTWFQLI
jgi:hypothetical protein